MKKASTKKKRTAQARVIGSVPHTGFSGVLWKVRLKVPHLPFFLESEVSYTTKADADMEAEKWRSRKVTVTVARSSGAKQPVRHTLSPGRPPVDKSDRGKA